MRTLLATAALALGATGFAACGDDDDDAQSLTITASGSGKNVKLQAPKSAETGLAEITVDNKTKTPVDAQMLFVEGDHSPQEVLEALAGAEEGKPFPEWFFGGGGGQAEPNQSATITQVLQPGTYYVLNTQAGGQPKASDLQGIEVTGEESDAELPEADATVTAIDYGFETEGDLKAGKNEITFENAGAQPHHILASPLVGNATAEDVEKFFKTDKGKPPLSRETASTSVLEGGTSQNVTLELKKPGTYALYCFIADRQGGPEHVFKGMVDEVEVE